MSLSESDAIHGLRAPTPSPGGRESVTKIKLVPSDPSGVVTLVCETCGASISPGSRGTPKRFCSSTCRQRAHRGVAVAPREAPQESGNTRDLAVSRLCNAIKSADGLRAGLDALARIIEDERAQIAAMPEYTRRELAQRLAGIFGFTLKEEHTP